MFRYMALPALLKRRQSMPDCGSDDDTALVSCLHDSKFLMAYFMWKAVKDSGKPPRLAKFQWKGQPVSPDVFTVAVEHSDKNTPNFRFIQVGHALEARLCRRIVGSLASELGAGQGDGSLGSLAGAYRRCAHTLQPSYERVNFDFGDGTPVTFERLLLPFVDTKERITHLMGVVLFDEGHPQS